jgi:parallel beta-helix repeat protein
MRTALLTLCLVFCSVEADIIHVPGQYPTIQQGIDAARAGDIVLVAPGRYPEEILLKAGVVVRGAGEGRSVIDGQNDPGDVVRAIGNAIGPDTKLEGFTITGARNSGGMPGGGGVFCNSGARPEVANCRIQGNDCGIALWNGSTACIHNCVVADNIYDGISTGSGATIVNNTIHRNRIGFYDYSGYGPVFMNNIVTRNSLYGVYGPSGGSPPQLTYNDVWGNATNYQQATPGTGSISRDPLYADTLTGDFRLMPGSPCIDSGNPATQYNDPDGSRNDMGAYGGPGAVSTRPEITTLVPAQNALHVSPATNVAAGFNTAMDWTTVTSRTFAARGAWTGTHYGSLTCDTLANMAVLDPDSGFRPGEPVTAVLSKGIVSARGDTFSGFAWDFLVRATGGSGQLIHARDVETGDGANSILAADFNRDGNLDLAVVCLNAARLAIMLGRGNGGFDTLPSCALGPVPQSLCVGDFDADSILDLALALGGANQVAVLIGNGDGTFAAPVSYAASTNPFGVVCADLDLDGALDLATSSYGSDRIAVLLGNGDGTFGVAAHFTTGSTPLGLVCADLDNNGFPDLVTADQGASTVSVLRGNGDGTFAGAVSHPVGTNPIGLACADLDGDGDIDAVSTDWGADSISVLFGDGSGGLGSRRSYRTGREPISVALTDLNADGALDVVTADARAGEMSVFLNNGRGVLGPRSAVATGAEPSSVGSGDFDGDGDKDAATANYRGDNVSILLNQDALTVTQVSPEQHAVAAEDSARLQARFNLTLDPTTLDSASFLAHGAMTGLHRGGIAYDSATMTATLVPRQGFAPGEPVSAMLSTRVRARTGVYLRGFGWSFTTRVPSGSSGTFAAAANYPTGAEPRGEWCADFDGDGDIDITTTSNSPAAVCLLRNSGDGTFASPVYTGVASDPISLFGADFDSDGDIDLACFHNQPGTSALEILTNSGNGTFTVSQSLAPAILGQQVWGGDLDADGDIDLVLTDGWGSQNNVRIMTNNGAGAFSGPVNYSAGSWARGVVLSDVDNDGDPDIIVANAGNDNVSVLHNDGRGIFPRLANYTTAAAPDGIFASDLNADNWVDLATAHPTAGVVSVLLNTQDGTFGPAASYATRLGHFALDGADLDGDSDIDLAFACYNSDSAAVLRNNGQGVFDNLALYHVASPPWRVRTADFNRDGAIDLALPCYTAGSVSVLLATGLGLAGPDPLTTGPSITLSPNPFHTATAITLRLGSLARAKLVVSDAAGRAVRAYSLQPSQTIQVWDGKDDLGRPVAPGVYFIRLKTPQACRVEKAVLAR